MISKELESFVKRLVDYFHGDVTVILFGSRARGDFNRASDYDLIVVSKRLKGNPLRRTRPLYELNDEFLDLDILAYTPSEFLRAMESLSPSVLDAMKEGILLHDNGFYKTAKRHFEELKRKGLRKERYWRVEGFIQRG
ncbi:nucleotidyltransferase domain-containing protein [Thermococcus indicus]|uniref:Nucleotidyltransferase domain-containing protein n=1 Tax=Thermococcus indicus TaxID=2586643 RepID=A0A4Y5SMN4_9EURY|nr:nucleotidyltransferase domain-containing protein [Thermococcus indicus]QDA32157.1 nucleotidyltransferase domain-containing protein [Thermococcus indicus]